MIQEPLSYTTCPGQKDGVIILKISGPLTLTNMFGFQTSFREMKPPVLIVDLSDSLYMDSAGLGVIMNQYVSAEANQRKFLLTGVSDRIQSLMELTHVSTVLKIYPTVADAEAVA
jgi:anti-anti-sigma factor